jgi:hypothetical protein
MKLIPIHSTEKFNAPEIYQTVAGQAPKGCSPAEMRQRVRILDVLAATKPGAAHFLLEDSDHALLKRLVDEFPFALAHADLLKIIDAVIEAKEPPAVVLPKDAEAA